jgi:hypothetical protein
MADHPFIERLSAIDGQVVEGVKARVKMGRSGGWKVEWRERTLAWALRKAPPSLAAGHPSPAAMHAREGVSASFRGDGWRGRGERRKEAGAGA